MIWQYGANNGLIRLNKFVCNLFYYYYPNTPIWHLNVTSDMSPLNFSPWKLSIVFFDFGAVLQNKLGRKVLFADLLWEKNIIPWLISRADKFKRTWP